jgi:hypothetical protein
MRPTRIVKETTEGGVERFYLEELYKILWVIPYWERHDNFRHMSGSLIINCHATAEDCALWLTKRTDSRKQQARWVANRKVAKVEIVKTPE